MAVSLIDALTSDWDPTSYRDTYRDRVLQLIEAKRVGEVVETAVPEPRRRR
jgi:DNA end-binding protein Ku